MKHPLLTEMIHELALDNYGSYAGSMTKPESEWVWPANRVTLELQAAKLSAAERSTLVAGEASEVLAIVERHGVGELNSFLGQVFDGPLHFYFFHNTR